jgi:hypothetical protein
MMVQITLEINIRHGTRVNLFANSKELNSAVKLQLEADATSKYNLVGKFGGTIAGTVYP